MEILKSQTYDTLREYIWQHLQALKEETGWLNDPVEWLFQEILILEYAEFIIYPVSYLNILILFPPALICHGLSSQPCRIPPRSNAHQFDNKAVRQPKPVR